MGLFDKIKRFLTKKNGVVKPSLDFNEETKKWANPEVMEFTYPNNPDVKVTLEDGQFKITYNKDGEPITESLQEMVPTSVTTDLGVTLHEKTPIGLRRTKDASGKEVVEVSLITDAGSVEGLESRLADADAFAKRIMHNKQVFYVARKEEVAAALFANNNKRYTYMTKDGKRIAVEREDRNINGEVVGTKKSFQTIEEWEKDEIQKVLDRIKDGATALETDFQESVGAVEDFYSRLSSQLKSDSKAAQKNNAFSKENKVDLYGKLTDVKREQKLGEKYGVALQEFNKFVNIPVSVICLYAMANELKGLGLEADFSIKIDPNTKKIDPTKIKEVLDTINTKYGDNKEKATFLTEMYLDIVGFKLEDSELVQTESIFGFNPEQLEIISHTAFNPVFSHVANADDKFSSDVLAFILTRNAAEKEIENIKKQANEALKRAGKKKSAVDKNMLASDAGEALYEHSASDEEWIRQSQIKTFELGIDAQINGIVSKLGAITRTTYTAKVIEGSAGASEETTSGIIDYDYTVSAESNEVEFDMELFHKKYGAEIETLSRNTLEIVKIAEKMRNPQTTNEHRLNLHAYAETIIFMNNALSQSIVAKEAFKIINHEFSDKRYDTAKQYQKDLNAIEDRIEAERKQATDKANKEYKAKVKEHKQTHEANLTAIDNTKNAAIQAAEQARDKALIEAYIDNYNALVKEEYAIASVRKQFPDLAGKDFDKEVARLLNDENASSLTISEDEAKRLLSTNPKKAHQILVQKSNSVYNNNSIMPGYTTPTDMTEIHSAAIDGSNKKPGMINTTSEAEGSILGSYNAAVATAENTANTATKKEEDRNADSEAEANKILEDLSKKNITLDFKKARELHNRRQKYAAERIAAADEKLQKLNELKSQLESLIFVKDKNGKIQFDKDGKPIISDFRMATLLELPSMPGIDKSIVKNLGRMQKDIQNGHADVLSLYETVNDEIKQEEQKIIDVQKVSSAGTTPPTKPVKDGDKYVIPTLEFTLTSDELSEDFISEVDAISNGYDVLDRIKPVDGKVDENEVNKIFESLFDGADFTEEQLEDFDKFKNATVEQKVEFIKDYISLDIDTRTKNLEELAVAAGLSKDVSKGVVDKLLTESRIKEEEKKKGAPLTEEQQQAVVADTAKKKQEVAATTQEPTQQGNNENPEEVASKDETELKFLKGKMTPDGAKNFGKAWGKLLAKLQAENLAADRKRQVAEAAAAAKEREEVAEATADGAGTTGRGKTGAGDGTTTETTIDPAELNDDDVPTVETTKPSDLAVDIYLSLVNAGTYKKETKEISDEEIEKILMKQISLLPEGIRGQVETALKEVGSLKAIAVFHKMVQKTVGKSSRELDAEGNPTQERRKDGSSEAYRDDLIGGYEAGDIEAIKKAAASGQTTVLLRHLIANALGDGVIDKDSINENAAKIQEVLDIIAKDDTIKLDLEGKTLKEITMALNANSKTKDMLKARKVAITDISAKVAQNVTQNVPNKENPTPRTPK